MMLVASETETGGIQAPAITINARCDFLYFLTFVQILQGVTSQKILYFLTFVQIPNRNPQTMKGWRGNETGDILEICSTNTQNIQNTQNTSISLETCINQRTFGKSDILDDVLLGYSRKVSLLNSDLILTYESLDVVGGKYSTLQLARNISPNYKESMLFLLLKYGFVYKIWVHDPKYFAVTTNPAYLHFLLEILDSDKTENYYYNLLLTGW